MAIGEMAHNSGTVTPYFATAARGLEPLIAKELISFGASEVQEKGGGVRFSGDVEVAYRACLWSRLASRVLLPLATIALEGDDATEPLYQGAMQVPWTDIFGTQSKFAIEVAGHAPSISHTHYAGLKVKDAIVDTFRANGGTRPDVDLDDPDLRVHLHLHKLQATLSLDLSGNSLHRRGYRRPGSEAPLKENLAAAILLRAGWPELAKLGAPLLDPMCGSGTLVIEAGLMAANVAPGLARARYGFEAWLEHKPVVWRQLKAEAEAMAKVGLAGPLPVLRGSDMNPAAIRAASDNAKRAGLTNKTSFFVADLSEVRPSGPRTGLVVTNPPYGERLGEEAEVIKLHSILGGTLKQHFAGWQAAVFTGRPDLGPRIGLRAKDMYSLYNGPLPCKLLCFDVPGAPVAAIVAEASGAPVAKPAASESSAPAGAKDFANRLNKNLTHLRKWAKRSGVSCYRAYDGDLPDYAVAVDVYASKELHIYVQEYLAPKTIDPVKAEKRLREALSHIQHQFKVPATRLHYRLRKSQKGDSQYRKQADTSIFHEIDEHGCRLLVNFADYLDTGLYLDHRPLRQRIQKESEGKSFLNLFCYTASATAHAVQGGATRTVSVDMSNTYLEWGQRNLKLNGAAAQVVDRYSVRNTILPEHALIRADCRVWLEEQAALDRPLQFDRILLDPPTFSNSKKMEGTLDIQRDHPALVNQAAALLAPGGVLYFSCNRRSFKLDTESLGNLQVADITLQTLDEDFKRPPPSHRCWRIQK